jgi:MFS family permease
VSGPQVRRVVGVVAGSHLLNHANLVLLAPFVATLSGEFATSAGGVGLVIGTTAGVAALLQLPFGYLSDAYGRTPMLALSLSAGAVGAFLLTVVASYAGLVAAAGVVGIGVAAHHPAHYPLLAGVASEDNRGRAYGVHALGGEVGFAVPFALVGGTAAFGLDPGWRALVGFVAASSLVGGIAATLALRPVDESVTGPSLHHGSRVARDGGDGDGAERNDPGDGPLARVRVGLADAVGDPRTLPARAARRVRLLVANPGIRDLTALSVLTSAAAWCVRTYVATLVSGPSGYGLPPDQASLLASAMLATGAGLVLVGGVLTDRVGVGHVLVGGYLALACIAGALATGVPTLAPGWLVPVVLVVLVVPLSGTITLSRPARSAVTDRFSDRTDVGQNFALVTVGISVGGAVSPPAFGWLIDSFGDRPAFAAVAGLALASALLAVRVANRTRAPA